MKNKLVINIIIAYFVVLCVVLIIQINDNDSEVATQVQTVEVDAPNFDKMTDSVFIKIGSSSVLMNDRLFSIDEKNETLVPKIIDGMCFVPAKLFSSAFKGNISWDNDLRELVIRYNNKAVILRENENKMRIVDNINEEEMKIEQSVRIFDGSSYVPLKAVAEAFDKNVFFDRDVIIVSNQESVFDKDDERELIDDIIEKFKLRNVFVFEKNNLFVYGNNKTYSIEENNRELVPLDDNGQLYIPIKMVSSVFGGENSWNGELKEITLKYNNCEAVFNNKNDKVLVTKNGEETEFQMPEAFKIINEYSYLSVAAFSDIFDKNIFIDGDFVIMSGLDNVFNK